MHPGSCDFSTAPVTPCHDSIYGTGLPSLCLLAGLMAGRMIGAALGVDADVGGVGIAMILPVFGSDTLRSRGLMKAPTEGGIAFRGQM